MSNITSSCLRQLVAVNRYETPTDKFAIYCKKICEKFAKKGQSTITVTRVGAYLTGEKDPLIARSGDKCKRLKYEVSRIDDKLMWSDIGVDLNEFVLNFDDGFKIKITAEQEIIISW